MENGTGGGATARPLRRMNWSCLCGRVAHAVGNFRSMTAWANRRRSSGNWMRHGRRFARLLGRKKRKHLAGAAIAEVERRRILDVDRVHLGKRRPVSAAFDQLCDRRRWAGDQHLDGAVESVADPALEAEP